MTTKISESAQERTFKQVAREQFDAFERRERLIRMEERRERAVQLRLPTNPQTTSPSPKSIGVRPSLVSGVALSPEVLEPIR
jgi:hypothetical protein